MPIHGDLAEDVATSSNFREVKIKKYELEMVVKFESREIVGVLYLPCTALKTINQVILDVHDTLSVNKVVNGDGEELVYTVKPFTGYGSSLIIQLGSEVTTGSEFTLKINYVATTGPGVCWLDPQQTAGKGKPYLYTQGQAVMNRSFFPNQDTPAVKAPYSASVQIPEGLQAVMSANTSSHEGQVYRFEQSVPIQTYLIALAVGDLVSADIGPRSRVWTEPCLLERAKAEFDGVVEDFITTGEKLFGPYVWGRYDILVMPPSFPYGGMENPCLTFVTPCLLAGDKSMTDVIIHEISHSWFGNLVTNANWSEFWLNEGFTMFAQRRIEEKLFGSAVTCLETQTGRALLRQQMDTSGEDHPLNRLRVIIEPGVDPDDTYNETPYEKGYMFVSYLQSLVGNVDQFDEFLKSYVDKFKYKSVVAEDMIEYYFEYFPDLKKKEVHKRDGYDFDSWLNKSGWPPYEPDLSAGKELTLPAEQLVEKWMAYDGQAPSEDISKWRTFQVLHFLDVFLEKERYPEGSLKSFIQTYPHIVNSDNAEVLHSLDVLLEKERYPEGSLKSFIQTYPHIVNSDNAEICLRWGKIVIKQDYGEEFIKVEAFLQRQGKQKYTLPLYKSMMRGSQATKDLAEKIYQSTKDQLHVQVSNYVEKIIGKTST